MTSREAPKKLRECSRFISGMKGPVRHYFTTVILCLAVVSCQKPAPASPTAPVMGELTLSTDGDVGQRGLLDAWMIKFKE
jgi:hypothetical protein